MPLKPFKNIVYTLLAIILALIGLAYAAVPLYQLFCQTTGFGGTPKVLENGNNSNVWQNSHSVSNTQTTVTGLKTTDFGYTKTNLNTIRVEFNADCSANMPITFEPLQKELFVVPGQPALIFYLATNQTKEVLMGISTYNVTPLKAGSYFTKIQCFCFEEQRFKPGESVELPVLFVIEPQITEIFPTGGNITLSYTFFRSNVGSGDSDV